MSYFGDLIRNNVSLERYIPAEPVHATLQQPVIHSHNVMHPYQGVIVFEYQGIALQTVTDTVNELCAYIQGAVESEALASRQQTMKTALAINMQNWDLSSDSPDHQSKLMQVSDLLDLDYTLLLEIKIVSKENGVLVDMEYAQIPGPAHPAP